MMDGSSAEVHYLVNDTEETTLKRLGFQSWT